MSMRYDSYPPIMSYSVLIAAAHTIGCLLYDEMQTGIFSENTFGEYLE